MQSERRHELGENTLARELNSWSDRLRPYTSAILAVVAGLLVVYIAASLWNSYRENRDRAAWDDYQLAVLEGDMEQRSLQRLAVSEDHDGTDMQQWAMIGWADRQLLRAAQMYLSSGTGRDDAEERVTDVIGIYQGLVDNAGYPEIRNRAQLGLARAFEIKGDLKQAREHYEQVQGALADVAKQRLEELKSKKVDDTAKWLATVELPKATTPPGPGTPGDRPGFEASTPASDPVGGAAAGAGSSISELFGELGIEDPSRYDTPAAAPAGDAAATKDGEPAADGAATEGSTDAAAETPAEAAAAPADEPAATEPAASGDAAPSEEAATAADQPAEQGATTTESPAEQPAAEQAPAEGEAAEEAQQPAASAPAEQ
jgi:hypothetical protein